MGLVGSRKPGILVGRLGRITNSVGRIGSQNLDPRATLCLDDTCRVGGSGRAFQTQGLSVNDFTRRQRRMHNV